MQYVLTARAKGLMEFTVIYRHALKNALIPVLTASGLQFGILLGRSVVIESVFAYPGIGRILLVAIHTRDLPVIQAAVFLFAVGIVFINLTVELLYVWADPRAR